MRTTADRIRHTLLFEIIGLCTCTPLASWILDKDLSRIALVALNRPVNVRPTWMRVLHAVLFELSLLTLTVPFVAWWLDLSLWHALIADIGFALFFLVYAFV
ncbi:PACE efflux transporter, partial [Aduncisulcus paluster]